MGPCERGSHGPDPFRRETPKKETNPSGREKRGELGGQKVPIELLPKSLKEPDVVCGLRRSPPHGLLPSSVEKVPSRATNNPGDWNVPGFKPGKALCLPEATFG